MSQREWADCPPGCDGVELLQARFERHIYDRHMHDTYAIGVTLRGVQRFWCRGSYHDSTPGQVMIIRPGEANTSSLGVTFQADESGASRTRFVARPEHDGWPGLLHGGVPFALLDDAAGWAARFSGQPCVTSRASIRYRQPVPTHTGLDIVGRVRRRGRLLTATAAAGRTATGSVVAQLEALLFPRSSREERE